MVLDRRLVIKGLAAASIVPNMSSSADAQKWEDVLIFQPGHPEAGRVDPTVVEASAASAKAYEACKVAEKRRASSDEMARLMRDLYVSKLHFGKITREYEKGNGGLLHPLLRTWRPYYEFRNRVRGQNLA